MAPNTEGEVVPTEEIHRTDIPTGALLETEVTEITEAAQMEEIPIEEMTTDQEILETGVTLKAGAKKEGQAHTTDQTEDLRAETEGIIHLLDMTIDLEMTQDQDLTVNQEMAGQTQVKDLTEIIQEKTLTKEEKTQRSLEQFLITIITSSVTTQVAPHCTQKTFSAGIMPLPMKF